jgi:hypothetical protein
VIDGGDFVLQLGGDAFKPCADDAGGGGDAGLHFAVIAGFGFYVAAGGLDFGFGRDVLFGQPFLAAAPGIGEGDGAGKQSFAEDFDGEGAGSAACVPLGGHDLLDGFAKLIEGGAEGDFLGCEGEHEGLRGQTGAEAGRVGAFVDFAFESSDDDLLDAAAFGVAELVGLAEADGVEDFEESGEAAGVAVVWRGAEEQAMFELGCEQSEHAAEIAVISEG